MAISPYIRGLRAHVGSLRLLLPSVSVHLFDDAGRLLLVRQRDGDVWSTPGGLIEPDERPADAATRELWEETGLVLRPERLLGRYGGPECVVRYENGDEVQYVIAAIGGTIIGGTMRPDEDETVAVQYWSQHEARSLTLSPWLQSMLAMVYAGAAGAAFAPATWSPPEAQDTAGDLAR